MTIPAVTAGDLITADLMNQIIQKLNQLDGAAPSTGNINVPAVVGMKLSAARSVIISPLTQLSLGFVIDAGGNSVDLSSLPSLERIVINQVPGSGAKVTAGTAVNLVVSGSTGGSGPSQPLPPKITGFSPTKVPVLQEVQIIGENFGISRFDNHVFFDNIEAAVPSAASGPTSLFVVIPQGIPNAPTDASELKVDVKVEVTGGSSVTLSDGLTILAPLAGPALTITGVTPAIIATGQDATIIGTGFSATLNENTIEFSTTTSPVVSALPKSSPEPGKLVVTVPTNIVGLTQPGTFGTVNIVVKVGQKKSPAFGSPIQVP